MDSPGSLPPSAGFGFEHEEHAGSTGDGELQAIVVLQKDLFGETAVQRHEKFGAVFATDQPVSAIVKDYN
jgi:hypothetical protein